MTENGANEVRPRTIVHVLPSVAREASGPSHSVMGLCSTLQATERDVILAAVEGGTWQPDTSYLRLFPRGGGPKRLGRSPEMYAWLRQAVSAREVALVHNHSLWMMTNVYPGWVTRKSGVPLVVSPRGTLSSRAFRHGSSAKRWFWPLVQRPAIDSAACFHATALHEYHDIRRRGFRQPVAVIPNGVNVPERRERNEGPMRTLLYLGRLHPIKGIDRLLRAWAVVAPLFPDWQLRLVGPDNVGHQGVLERLVADLRLPRTVFAGPAFGEDKWREHASADLYVLPTHSENFGMSVAEALASATPAIVTQGAPWEGLETHGAGWWIEHGVDPLVETLKEALARPRQELRTMGENGRTWVEAEFSWQRVGEHMSLTYDWILNGGTPPEWVFLD